MEKATTAVRKWSPPPAAPRAPEPKAERLTVSLEYAAAVLGISRAAAYNYAKDGRLPAVRLGTRWLVPKAVLEKLLTPA